MKTLGAAILFLAAIGLSMTGCNGTNDAESPTESSPTTGLTKTTMRSIDEFVAAQGTFCFDDGNGGCLLFVPPVANFLGWSQPKEARAASVDYAGLADRYITQESGGTKSLGTTFSGSVTERELSDGRVLISVDLHTRNALSWAVKGFDYAHGTLLYGRRAPEVLAGATASLSDSHLKVEFTMPKAGEPLPDLLKVLADPDPGMSVRSMQFVSSGEGQLRSAYGVPDGTPGRLQVTQTGIFHGSGRGALADGYPAEHVKLSTTGR